MKGRYSRRNYIEVLARIIGESPQEDFLGVIQPILAYRDTFSRHRILDQLEDQTRIGKAPDTSEIVLVVAGKATELSLLTEAPQSGLPQILYVLG